ncbi:MAG: aminotransferase class III-fold pyridoxal phosphate-dependent enzyme, partial [Proteobacteria bacterium]|nr:aminotransferase class III-fold pyridoxal phosphate-dependent enzyme [Pseudomonadota bacterium]
WGITPDMMTVAKGITSGYIPMGGAILRKPIADAFVGSPGAAFRHVITFGGHPVAAAAALKNIEIMEREGMVENSAAMGAYLLDGLKELKEKHQIIGDVRGLGLFIGIELVKDRDSLAPAAAQASYIAERMKQSSVLIGTDGPLHNVLKIKPPMCFDRADADSLLAVLESVLGEDFAQYNR